MLGTFWATNPTRELLQVAASVLKKLLSASKLPGSSFEVTSSCNGCHHQ